MSNDFDFTFKQGDTAVVASDTLTLADGTVPDFTGATVQFVMRSELAAGPLTLTGTSVFTSTLNGEVRYSPTVTDLIPGEYIASWVVTFSDGSVMTFPTVGYLTVLVEESLLIASAQQLVTLAAVKDHLDMPANKRISDEKLMRWIGAITLLIEHHVGPVIIRQFEEWHDGGQTFVRLRRRPSTAIGTSPVINLIACSEYNGPIEWPLAIVSSPDLGGTYSCMLDRQRARVERRTAGGGVQPFPQMPEAVHVIYEAGQQEVPMNVQEAAMETVRVYHETTMSVGKGSRSRADEQDTGPAIGYVLPTSARRLLAPNKRHPAVA